LNSERIRLGLLVSRVCRSGVQWFRLLRLPNLLTVPGDPLAGMMLANSRSTWSVAWPVAASLSLYAAGLVLNDLVDIEEDCLSRPMRPLPSGKISFPAAKAICISLFVTGLSLSAARGPAGLLVGFVLVAVILGYNLGLKSLPIIGPLSMGSCRGLSLFLGAVVTRPGWAQIGPLIGAGWVASYIASVANLAKDESAESRSAWREWLAPGVLTCGFAFAAGGFVHPKNGAALAGLLILAFAAACSAIATVSLSFRDRPSVASHVGFLIHLLLPIQAFLCATSASESSEGLRYALILSLLWPITRTLSRHFYAS
jgi:hypothetical protein